MGHVLAAFTAVHFLWLHVFGFEKDQHLASLLTFSRFVASPPTCKQQASRTLNLEDVSGENICRREIGRKRDREW